MAARRRPGLGWAAPVLVGPVLVGMGWGLLSLVVSNSYYQLMLTLVPVWAVFALAWNLFSGYSGLLSFGHAVFFGAGAYAVTLGAARYGIPPWIGIPIAAACGAFASLLIGALTFRLRDHYFALAMLAYPLAVIYLIDWAGLSEVSYPMRRDAPRLYMQFENPKVYTCIALGLFLATLVACMLAERSVFGMSLRAAGENEAAAEAVGIDSRTLRLKALVLSGGLSVVAGGFYSVVLLLVTPQAVFGMLTSAQPMIMTLFGGIGTVWGPVIGTAVLIPLSETLRAELGSVVPGIQGIVFGLTIIAVVLAAPQGLYWSVRGRLLSHAAPPPPQPLQAAAPDAVAIFPGMAGPEGDGQPLLQADGLSKSFGGLHAVADVSFTVRRGEILGIIGPNGAGKTTLFNMLSGFVVPSRGVLRLRGAVVTGLAPHDISRRGVGRIFQVVRTFPRMSLVENVLVGAFQATGTREAAGRAALEAISRVGLSHRLDAGMTELTNHELRLMELARAIASRPELVLMDEPLAGLGRAKGEVFLSLLRQLTRQGLTIVLIEHTMHVMVRLVDRLVVLDHGQVIGEGLPGAVLNDPAVTEAYLGKKWGRRAEARSA